MPPKSKSRARVKPQEESTRVEPVANETAHSARFARLKAKYREPTPPPQELRLLTEQERKAFLEEESGPFPPIASMFIDKDERFVARLIDKYFDPARGQLTPEARNQLIHLYRIDGFDPAASGKIDRSSTWLIDRVTEWAKKHKTPPSLSTSSGEELKLACKIDSERRKFEDQFCKLADKTLAYSSADNSQYSKICKLLGKKITKPSAPEGEWMQKLDTSKFTSISTQYATALLNWTEEWENLPSQFSEDANERVLARWLKTYIDNIDETTTAINTRIATLSQLNDATTFESPEARTHALRAAKKELIAHNFILTTIVPKYKSMHISKFDKYYNTIRRWYAQEPDHPRLISPILTQLAEEMKEWLVDPSKIAEIRLDLARLINRWLITPGEAVGAIHGMSIMERATQTNLNTFHTSGVATEIVLPAHTIIRMIISYTKKENLPEATMTIPIIDPPEYPGTGDVSWAESSKINPEQMKAIMNALAAADKIFCMCDWRSLHTLYEIQYVGDELPDPESYIGGREPQCTDLFSQPWWSLFEQLYWPGDRPTTGWMVKIRLNLAIVFRFQFTLRLIVAAIRDRLTHKFGDHFRVAFSPISSALVYIYFDSDGVDLDVSRTEYCFIRDVIIPYILKSSVIYPSVAGIPIAPPSGSRVDLEPIDPKDPTKIAVKVDYSSLADTLCLPYIDPYGVTTNSVEDAYKTLGIEAAWKTMITQLANSGVKVDDEHFKFIAEKICWAGQPRPLSHFGIDPKHVGSLSKALFQNMAGNFANATINNEFDKVLNSEARIATGMAPLVGTNAFDIVEIREPMPEDDEPEPSASEAEASEAEPEADEASEAEASLEESEPEADEPSEAEPEASEASEAEPEADEASDV